MRLWCAVLATVLGGGAMVACGSGNETLAAEESRWEGRRQRMVDEQIFARGVRDEDVLDAMRRVPRHEFVPAEFRAEAYRDSPLPIGEGQTISQPYIVALMSELLEVHAGDRVLEIGTGSGYQAAVLAALGVEVFSIEIKPRLCQEAAAVLEDLGYEAVHVRCGDGYGGWPEAAPFDGIIVTAAPDRIPEPLVEQLELGARMVIPVGSFYQELKVLTRTEAGVSERSVIPVRFVPMTGEIERRP